MKDVVLVGSAVVSGLSFIERVSDAKKIFSRKSSSKKEKAVVCL